MKKLISVVQLIWIINMGDTMTKKKDILDKPVYQEFNRMDVIGQNGNDGTHYDEIDNNMDAIKYIEKEYPETAKEFQKIQKIT